MFKLHRPLVVDFETYYKEGECSVKACPKKGWVGGPWHYTNHPDFYAYLASWYDIATGEKGTVTQEGLPSFVASINGRTMVAHNASFDYAVAKQILPEFEPFNTFDTADMVSYLQCGRSLATASEVLLGVPVDKSMRAFMDGKHWRDIGPEKQRDMTIYALGDAEHTTQLFIRYHQQWPLLEQWASDFNRRQNWAGVYIDQEYLAEQIDRVSAFRSAAVAKIPWVENIDTDKPLSAKKLAVYCREVGIPAPASLAEDSEECQAWENTYGGQYPVVGALRDFRKSNALYKKFLLIEQLVRPDGTMPLATKYAAAPHTLRYSATQFNYQNMPRSTSYCDLRGCIAPAPGHSFVGVDLAGIEGRCLPWLAGDTPYLAEVTKLDKAAWDAGVSGGGDIYEPHCRRMFNYSDPRPLKKVDKNLRGATKECVLQLGYQSGAKKFLFYLENNVAPEVLDRVRQGSETNAALAKRLVDLYRSMNPKVVNLWKSLNNELQIAQATVGQFTVQQPNGRMVNYYGLGKRINTRPDGSTFDEVVGSVCRGEPAHNLYGGKITENICQEMARHVFVEAMYRLTEAGYRIRMSVHDEHLVEVPAGQATAETLRDVERIMSQTPSWAPGLPLAAEANIMQRYAK